MDNGPLLHVSFVCIFSQSVNSFFILLTVSFIEEKNLIKFSLSILPFMDWAFGVVSKMPLPNTRSSRFLLCHFIVLHAASRSAVHFELIFVKAVKSMHSFCFFACGYPAFSAAFVGKKLSLLHCIAFAHLSKIRRQDLCVSVLKLCSISLISLSVVLPITYYLYYCKLYGKSLSLEVGQCKSSNFLFSFSVCVGYSGLHLHINFRTKLLKLIDNLLGFYWDRIESISRVGKY